jgi:hypothetical protein
MPPERLIGFFFWKFVASEEAGFIYWRWEARVHSGRLVHSSRHFETLTECDEDALAWGYVPPEEMR